jgi:predicted nucleic acid-binding protein
MAAFYLDTSAAAKLYVDETGSVWMSRLFNSHLGHQFFVNRATSVEIAAALFRRVKAGQLQRDEARDALDIMRDDVAMTYEVVEFSHELMNLAIEVAEKFALRGYDCVQLAGSLLTQRYRLAAGLTAATFVSADVELNLAARSEGLTVENPSDYP